MFPVWSQRRHKRASGREERESYVGDNIMKILDELRLFLCYWCFDIITYLAPSNNPEGIRILKIIRDWSAKEISLRGQTESKEDEPADWTFYNCPKCGLPFIARDKWGLFCATGNCDWKEQDEVIK